MDFLVLESAIWVGDLNMEIFGNWKCEIWKFEFENFGIYGGILKNKKCKILQCGWSLVLCNRKSWRDLNKIEFYVSPKVGYCVLSISWME